MTNCELYVLSVFGALIILLLFYWIVTGIILSNNTLYCYFYENDDWKKWERFIEYADDFHFEFLDTQTGVVGFTDGAKYNAFIWEDGLCSIHKIHNENENCCILGTFNEKMSKRMADKLIYNYLNKK